GGAHAHQPPLGGGAGALPHRADDGWGRGGRLPLSVAAFFRRAAGRLLSPARRQQQPRWHGHHLSEVHVLMRGRATLRRSALALALRASVALCAVAGLACQTVDLMEPPADINTCRPSQMYYALGTTADGGMTPSVWD